jgi:hypothetical protein
MGQRPENAYRDVHLSDKETFRAPIPPPPCVGGADEAIAEIRKRQAVWLRARRRRR